MVLSFISDPKFNYAKMTNLTQRQLGVAVLLEYIRNIHRNDANFNLKIQCLDGSIMTYGIILASISPIIRSLGRTYPHNMMDFVLHLPDFTVRFI